jgi:YrbI family 3-deoxy-D-manno-octulosonate 8-phosphate phosphatase
MTEPDLASEIRLFVTDVDGTLTDGGMYYTARGEYMKRFNTRDGMGLSMLRDAGVEVAIMTSENSEIVLRRAEKLNITHVFVGVEDKLAQLKELCESLEVQLNRVAYVGDDVNDLDAMRNVGLAFAVADADLRVLDVANMRLSKSGGEGAVREAAEWILARLTSGEHPVPCLGPSTQSS